MNTEITLRIKIKAHNSNPNLCHPYCNFMHVIEGQPGVLCRLFRTEKYLKTDHSGTSVEFVRCDECLSAQRRKPVQYIGEEQ